MAPILLLLSARSLSLPLTPFLFILPSSSSLPAPCCSVLYSNFCRVKLERAEADKTWAVERRAWWSDADGGGLWEGCKGQQISGSHTEEKDDMNPTVLFSFPLSVYSSVYHTLWREKECQLRCKSTLFLWSSKIKIKEQKKELRIKLQTEMKQGSKLFVSNSLYFVPKYIYKAFDIKRLFFLLLKQNRLDQWVSRWKQDELKVEAKWKEQKMKRGAFCIMKCWMV